MMTDYFETDKHINDCSKFEKSVILYILLEEGCIRLYGSRLEEERVTKKDKLLFLDFMLEETNFYDEVLFRELDEEYPAIRVREACEYFLSTKEQLRYKY